MFYQLEVPREGEGVGQGDRKPGIKGEGSVWKAGKEMAGSGIPKVAGTERNKKQFRNIDG